MSFSNSRTACVQALQRWESEALFADEVLHSTLAAAHFNVFDRAFLTETFYGILRRRSALDFLIRQLRDTDLDSQTRQVLRLGFYQIFWMRIPHHAAVNETVNLAGRARGLVNALLRRAIREKDLLDRSLAEAPASIRFSHPQFLIERWERQFTPEGAARLCEWNNTPAEIFVRANGLKVTVGELLQASHGVEPSGVHPLSLKVKQVPFQWLMEGLCYVQDPSTLMAVELLEPKPGDTILDACAAPGGKTSYMAELMRNEGHIVACDSSRPRLERLKENLTRMSVHGVETRRVDWLAKGAIPFEPASFDRILVDAPCSNTGVIRRRVDVRWRLTPGDFVQMPQRQRAILDAVFPLLKPGGALVYSTCSIEPEEDELLAEAFVRDHPGARLEETRRRQPQVDAMDGAFAARILKAKETAPA